MAIQGNQMKSRVALNRWEPLGRLGVTKTRDIHNHGKYQFIFHNNITVELSKPIGSVIYVSFYDIPL